MRTQRGSVRALAAILAVLAGLLFQHPSAVAQELTPRAYWPAPERTNAAALAYDYSTGDILTDPSLPVTGLDSRIHAVQFVYLRTFSMFGRTANVQVAVPFAWGHTEGFLEADLRSRDVSGLGDMTVRSAINILGAPTMDVDGLRALRAKPRTQLGASLSIQMPTGEYEPDKLINLGSNRWAMKPELGVIWPFRPSWMLEVDVGVWFFGDNDEFLGVTREQAPILSTQYHLVKEFPAGLWAALDLNYYYGGRTTVDEDRNADLQRNSRAGGSLLYPFKRRHAVRFSYSTGVVTESGNDFEKFTLTYQYVWR